MSIISSGVAALSDRRRAAARRWRTIASFSFFLCGLGSIYWSLQTLQQITEVPDCTQLVEEKHRELFQLRDQGERDDAEENSEASVNWYQLGQIQVEIQGGVMKPGVYWLEYGDRLANLIDLAGGLSDHADHERFSRQFILSQKLLDEQKITVPIKQEIELEKLLAQFCASSDGISQSSVSQSSQSRSETFSTNIQIDTNDLTQQPLRTECISINYASSVQLQTLSGVGEKTAELIISARPYHKIADLLNVSGIGEVTLEKLKPFICL